MLTPPHVCQVAESFISSCFESFLFFFCQSIRRHALATIIMAIISHKKKFIFVHIYKTAGTTITDCLIKYATMKQRLAYDYYLTRKLSNGVGKAFNLYDSGKKWLTGYHKHATALEIRNHLGNSLHDRYYKFAFVRNPWDLLVSFYYYIRRQQDHKYFYLANKLTFKEFVKYYLDTLPLLQLDFLTDDKGNIIVDRIGKFENLQQDFQNILYELDLHTGGDRMYSLEFHNLSADRQRDYKIYYDEITATLVANYFSKDIDCFEYQFD